MIKTFKKYNYCGFIFTAAMGFLLHFLYEISGENSFVALFSAVNESVWEHLKLVFFPFLIFMIFLIFKFKPMALKIIPASLIGVLAGMISVLVIHYTYKGIFGEHSMFVDILSFFIAVAISYYISYKLTINPNINLKQYYKLAVIGFVILIIIFGIFTFNPPKIPLFYDSQEMIYGIMK